ncbi:hypothetical protein [Microbacterium sp. cf046]|uniref:hypothetical protein n=1 Tax=Microbacterium sp. cf046 TaxID=1761803 RepID=UPI0011145FF2|nr:hypothetical protein [Microbacterium sp. cf046]
MRQPARDETRDLVGRRLYSVVFVEDYIQLLFDPDPDQDGAPPHLDFFVLPTVVLAQSSFAPTDERWARALTALIGSTVLAFRTSPEAGLELRLDTGTVSLQANPEFDAAVEVALLDVHGTWDVWRPGERPFKR